MLLIFKVRYHIDFDDLFKAFIQSGFYVLAQVPIDDRFTNMSMFFIDDFTVCDVMSSLSGTSIHDETSGADIMLFGQFDELVPGFGIHMGVINHGTFTATQNFFQYVQTFISTAQFVIGYHMVTCSLKVSFDKEAFPGSLNANHQNDFLVIFG